MQGGLKVIPTVRENEKRKKNGKKKKGTRPKFDTPWREPKALIIFEFNEQGKMVKKERQPLIDGTLLGPDHLAELVAFHLHRLGVAQAELVVFISDGAPSQIKADNNTFVSL